MASAIRRIIEEMQTARLVSIRERGVIATCVEGRIWLTRDGDRNEHVLEAGESFTTADRNRVILQALSASRVFLDYTAKRDALPSMRGRFLWLLALIRGVAITIGKRLTVSAGRATLLRRGVRGADREKRCASPAAKSMRGARAGARPLQRHTSACVYNGKIALTPFRLHDPFSATPAAGPSPARSAGAWRWRR